MSKNREWIITFDGIPEEGGPFRKTFSPADLHMNTMNQVLGRNSPLTNCISGRLMKNDEMQGARILRNEAYNQHAAMTKDEASRCRSRFSTA